jgi:protocatechuate 3,4-dioxygenase beta subunit
MKTALFALIPVLALAQSPQQQPEKATLEGQLVNAVGGEGLRKVRLSLRMNVARQGAQPQQLLPARGQRSPAAQPQPTPPPAPAAVTVVSDLTGKFLFENLEPGNYQLTARRDGFADVTLGNQQVGKKTEPIILAPGDHKMGLLLKMIPYGAISGRLVDEDGDPIQNMAVTTMTYTYTSRGRELAEGMSATTDDRGEYRIFNVPPGKYFLKAGNRSLRMGGRDPEAKGYAPAFFPGVYQAASAASLELGPGQQMTGMSMTLRAAHLATIQGHIVAPAGTDMWVGLMVTSDNGQSSSSSSDGVDKNTGKFKLSSVPQGALFVIAGYDVSGQRYRTQVPVEVGDSDIDGLELRPIAAMDVPGQLRIEGDTKLTMSQLQVMLQTRGNSNMVTPKDDGTLLFKGVNANTYRVQPNRAPGLYLKSVRWGNSDITDGELDLTAGLPANTELSVVLGADAAELEGVVKNDNDPAEAATVTLVPTGSHRSSPFYKSAVTDEAGHFTIRGIAPGTYKIIAWDKVNVNAVIYDPDFLRPYETAGRRIAMEPNGKQKVELKLTANQQP